MQKCHLRSKTSVFGIAGHLSFPEAPWESLCQSLSLVKTGIRALYFLSGLRASQKISVSAEEEGSVSSFKDYSPDSAESSPEPSQKQDDAQPSASDKKEEQPEGGKQQGRGQGDLLQDPCINVTKHPQLNIANRRSLRLPDCHTELKCVF